MTDDLKLKEQVNTASSIGNRMLGTLKKSFCGHSLALWRVLYTTYIRPHLEFAVQSWSPYLLQDIAKLEKLQQRTTKVISSIKHLPYDQRLMKLNLTTLVDRRIRGDVIEQYIINNKIDVVKFNVKQTHPLSQNSACFEGRITQ